MLSEILNLPGLKYFISFNNNKIDNFGDSSASTLYINMRLLVLILLNLLNLRILPSIPVASWYGQGLQQTLVYCH